MHRYCKSGRVALVLLAFNWKMSLVGCGHFHHLNYIIESQTGKTNLSLWYSRWVIVDRVEFRPEAVSVDSNGSDGRVSLSRITVIRSLYNQPKIKHSHV